MNSKYILRTVLFFLSVISLTSCCSKEEWDLDKKETESSTIVEGVVLSSNGRPLANINVKVDYHESKWLQYSKTRHKAEVRTDKNGKYRLHFSIQDDELETDKDKELSISKHYSLIYDLKNLSSAEYILPNDMSITITSVNPPVGELTGGVEPVIRYCGLLFERSKSYNQNLYIPQKKFIYVTLTGFIPQLLGGHHDSFQLNVAFPYGSDNYPAERLFPGSKYGYGRINYLFGLYAEQEHTFKIPVAVNENNIITLERCKNGIYSTEEHQIFISQDSPNNLVYQY